MHNGESERTSIDKTTAAMSNNNKKNDVIAQQCEQIRSRASMFDRGHIMNDYDLFIAASTILLCTGKMSESEMDDVTSCAGGSRQALPFLLSKVEKLGHKAFFSALGYVRRLNKYQAAHIENWYTSESKRAYAYKGGGEGESILTELADTIQH